MTMELLGVLISSEKYFKNYLFYKSNVHYTNNVNCVWKVFTIVQSSFVIPLSVINMDILLFHFEWDLAWLLKAFRTLMIYTIPFKLPVPNYQIKLLQNQQ